MYWLTKFVPRVKPDIEWSNFKHNPLIPMDGVTVLFVVKKTTGVNTTVVYKLNIATVVLQFIGPQCCKGTAVHIPNSVIVRKLIVIYPLGKLKYCNMYKQNDVYSKLKQKVDYCNSYFIDSGKYKHNSWLMKPDTLSCMVYNHKDIIQSLIYAHFY